MFGEVATSGLVEFGVFVAFTNEIVRFRGSTIIGGLVKFVLLLPIDRGVVTI